MNEIKLFSLAFMALLIACEDNSSPKDSDATTTDGDDAVLVADNGDALMGDDEQNDVDSFVRECNTSAECDESEFCDPYGSCMCDKGKGYTIRYNGKCMLGIEGAAFFCNNRANGYYVKHSVPRKGSIAYTDSVDDVVCLCGFGYWGQNCQNQIEGYGDLLPVFDPTKGIVPQMPEPNCIVNDDCDEWMECGKQGYCQCPGAVIFEDPAMDFWVRVFLGLDSSEDILGSRLIELINLSVENAQVFENAQCMPNIRGLALSSLPDEFNFSPIVTLKNLQTLMITASETCDFTPLEGHPNLLSIQVQANKDSYHFLEKQASASHLAELRVSFSDGQGPDNFSFLSDYKQLTVLELTYNEKVSSKEAVPIDIAEVAINNKQLAFLRIFSGAGEIKNIGALNELENLTHLAIAQNSLLPNTEAEKIITLKDFSLVPSVVDLILDSPNAQGDFLRNHFPNVTVYTQSNIHATEYDISLLSGMSNIKVLNISNWDRDYPKCDEINYVILGEMGNLDMLSISPYCLRESDWMQSLKYIGTLWLQSGDFINYGKRKEEYAATGPVNTSYIADLLYLHDYYDQLYRFETADIFVENCDKGGLFCNKDFQKSYFFAGEETISLSLCGNPIPADDPSVLELVERGVGVSVGEMNECEWLSPEKKLTENKKTQRTPRWATKYFFTSQGSFDSWVVSKEILYRQTLWYLYQNPSTGGGKFYPLAK